MARDGRYLHKSDITEDKIEKIVQLNYLAQERGQTLAQMALSWVLKDDEVTSVLIGASKPEQILENLKIIGAPEFTQNEIQRIEVISK